MAETVNDLRDGTHIPKYWYMLAAGLPSVKAA